jgi:5-formyltetrahydrofolate cyclo-ligase
MKDKTFLRKYAKEIRKNLDIIEKSKRIVDKIRLLPEYEKANNVMIFYPTAFEVNLLTLLDDDKNFYFPRVDGENLLVCPNSINIQFKKSKFNIFEPCSNPVNSEILDLIIVPALMVDKNNYRLGYGGGFYDKFLNNNPSIKTICPIFSELNVEYLPHEEFDIPVDIVVCG